MKYFWTIILLMLLTTTGFSQKGTFVRVFDEKGKKTHKGHLVNTSDSSLIIAANNGTVEIPVTLITSIKLRRSFGHTVLWTSLAVGGAMAIGGAASADPDAWIFPYSAAEGAFAGMVVGSIAGGTIGSIVSGTRKRPEILVNRKLTNWPDVRAFLKSYMPAATNKQFDHAFAN